MPRLILVLLISSFIGVAYSYIIQKFSNSKFIIFLPSIAGGLWVLYLLFTFNPGQTEGFYDVALFLMILIILALVLGNIISGIIFLRRKNI